MMFKNGKRILPEEPKVPTAYWAFKAELTTNGAQLKPTLLGKFDTVKEAQEASRSDYGQTAIKNVTPVADYEKAMKEYLFKNGIS